MADIVLVTFKIDAELLEKLDEMVLADDSDRSKFIRCLIRAELERRAEVIRITSLKELPTPLNARER